ncbi:MAG: hypothetical protein ACFFDD_06565 [Promethearchaeota archaeon]
MYSDCVIRRHVPRVTTLFTSTKGLIEPIIDPDANTATIIELR